MLRVVVWDIDGTLVRTRGGRVAVSAFMRALQLTSHLPDDLMYPEDASGKTDEQIALEVLLRAQIAEDVAAGMLSPFREIYLAELERDRERLIKDIRVLPGVPEALARLDELGVVQSLLTGNLEPVARLKLGCAGLDGHLRFELGAYGSDHRDRTCLVPIVRQRPRRHHGVDQADIVVVGDTPRDIECARAGGVPAIAVATGNFTRQELEAHQPDVVLDDLQDTDRVVA